MRWRSVVLGMLAALVAPAPAPAAIVEPATREGLGASTGERDWRLRVTNRAGSVVLEEARGAGAGAPGALGLRSGGLWRQATRVLSQRRRGDGSELTLATEDPVGRRLRVLVTPARDGSVVLRARVLGAPLGDGGAIGVAFSAAPGERFLGFGERSAAVDQRGREIENYVADGPWLPAENGFIGSFVPAAGLRLRDDATYFPIPWLLSGRGHGVLVLDDEPSLFRLATPARPGAWSVEVQAPHLGLRVFPGPRPADALRRFSAHVGRQPQPSAPFVLGPWFQPKGDEAANLTALREADAPVSVAQTYTHYLPCGDHVAAPEREAQRAARFHAAGLAVTTYFNPMVCTGYEAAFTAARDRELLTRNPAGTPYQYRYTGSGPFSVGQVDFSHPEAAGFYGGLLDEAVRAGYDGWMEDFGEYTPLDAVSADGTPGPAMHNRYPVLYHRAARAYERRATRPLARFVRSGWTGAAAQAPIVWGGDPSTDWGFDGLSSSVRQALGMGLSGVSVWGSDIGGFFTLTAPPLTPELLIRWIQFGAASGVMRTQANGFPSGGRRAALLDPEVLPLWRRYAKLRTQLYPYLAAAQREYGRTGLPLMRHLALVDPADPAATAREDQYLLGPDLLVAPVLEPGATSRALYLPRGAWVDLWRSAAYDPADGGLHVRGAHVLSGRREVTLPAPLSELPLLARAGAVLPLLSADVDTLADYGREGGSVRLRDRAGRLRLLAYPRGSWSGALGPGERMRSRETASGWTLELAGRTRRRYELEAALGALRRPLRPCALAWDGRPLPRSSWSVSGRGEGAVLRVRFRGRAGRLAVRGC